MQYGHKELEYLWQLRFYKELGCGRPEIKKILEASDYSREQELDRLINGLIEKRDQIDNMIHLAEMMREIGVSYGTILDSIGNDEMSFNDASSLLGSALSVKPTFLHEEESNITDTDLERWGDLFERIIRLGSEGLAVDEDEVQRQVFEIHRIVAKDFSESIILFRWFVLAFSPEGEIGKDIDKEFGTGKASFLYSACQTYCDLHADNPVDQDLMQALQEIERLGREGFSAGSAQVQVEVRRICKFVDGVHMLSQSDKLQWLTSIGKMFATKAYRQAIDNGASKGVAWFVSKAIEIYCQTIAQKEEE